MPAETTYLEVRLEADEQREHHFLLTANAAPAHYPVSLDPTGSFAWSDSLRRLGSVLAGRGDPTGQMAPQDLMRDVGVRLWQVLFPNTAPAQEREALAVALRNGLTPLLLTLPDALAALPWEVLCDPDVPGEQGFLARRRPLIRSHASNSSLTTPLTPPLRVLLLISSPISLREDSRVDVESERTAVEEATREAREAGLLHLHVEDIVTYPRVQEALMRFRPHVLHYIGHGAYDEQLGGVLLWEDNAGQELSLTASRLADLLRPRGLRAVVLHACQTARRDARTDTLGMAGTLVKAGIPAVLAQQANFSYASSQLASKTWYQALTNGYHCADALFEVRQALSDHHDWAVPVLYGSATSLVALLDNAAPAGEPDPRLTSGSIALSLPTPTGVFVGRHRELRALHLMLEHNPGRGPVLALITGPGGVGKSTLAAQAVTRYSGRYKAVLTLSCSAYEDFTLSVLIPIAEFLKGQGSPGLLDAILPDPTLSTAAKMDQAIAALNAAGPFLLIVDNLESVQNEDHTLRDADLLLFLHKLLAALRGGRILLTGCYAVQGLLPDGKFAAHVLHLDLDDLSPYETNRLMAHHPGLTELGEEVRKTLIREFGGLPYFYDLLSSQAARENLALLLHDIQGRITHEREQRTTKEWNAIRQRVIEFATLETTIDRLSLSARTLLARLSVLRRPFPLDALLQQGLSAARPDWQALLDWSLLRYDATDSTYRLHSLTHRYAQDALLTEPAERVQTQAQLADWYVHYADHDSHNLTDYLEAHHLYRASGNVQHAAQLALRLADGLRRFGLYSSLRALCTTTVQDMHERDESLMGEALYELGNIAYLQGNYPEAQRLYQQSLDIKEQLGDLLWQASSLHQLGMLARDQGNYHEARRLYQQSLKLFDQLGNRDGQAHSWHQLGILASGHGDYPEARPLLLQSLAIFDQLGDRNGQASFLHHLGMLAQRQGNYHEAQRLYQQSLAIFDQLGDRDGQAHSWHQLGILAQDQGNYPEAQRLYQQSLQIAEQLGDRDGQAHSLHQLGILAQDQGNYPEAQRLYQQSLVLFEQLGYLAGQAASLGQSGRLAYEQGDFELALAYTVRAFLLFEKLHDPYSSIAQSMLAEIRAQIGEATFLAQWRALVGDLPAPDEPDQEGSEKGGEDL